MAKRYNLRSQARAIEENRDSTPGRSIPAAGRPEATLLGLPTELQQNISSYLKVKDLCALRATSRHFASIGVTERSLQLAEALEEIQVLATKDGFKDLAAITSVPEFRKHVKRVRFFNPTRLFTHVNFTSSPFKHEHLARLNGQTTVLCANLSPEDFNPVVAPIMSALVSSGFSRNIVELGVDYQGRQESEGVQAVDPQYRNWSSYGGLGVLDIIFSSKHHHIDFSSAQLATRLSQLAS
ncbi:hypothetical protein BU23DRAFT_565992 [Bimuria novae-zelandiae CBS 107.79]|uniref:F-box domain-containing protein n=1 Tax=Bimuria novae-zelandiae CBS 107.79 TaxID=1447943 RepID=A0A6A5VKS2_9PLEO|nr:hypothetical protein BU23DRAFT_565992 [Bimuria novae-zelandiae CBS 107.79]